MVSRYAGVKKEEDFGDRAAYDDSMARSTVS
jgi:hypothetical protein